MRKLRLLREGNPLDERGVIAPLTAILMTALLGMTALAVDTAMMYSEHAQLQNGADAAALAIAQQCAKAVPSCSTDQDAAAASYANDNALDDHSYVPIGGAYANVAARTVDVTIQSRMPGPTNHFSLHFARALGISSATIRATATAKWKFPSTATGFPLALSRNCWNFGPTTAATMTLQKITWKPNTTCTNASGDKVSGGWGWLADTSIKPCEATTKVGDFATSNPGNDHPKTCETILTGWINTLSTGGKVHVLFPIFDTAEGSGNTGTFRIVGYATFSVFGWNFGEAAGPYKFRHDVKDPPMTNKLTCSDGLDRCLIGGFVKFQTSGGGDGGADFGTPSVSLIK